MTHSEAIARCAQLNFDEEGERRWFATQTGPDDWDLASVSVPGSQKQWPLKMAIEAKPRPPQPPDSRPTIIRHIPPYGAG